MLQQCDSRPVAAGRHKMEIEVSSVVTIKDIANMANVSRGTVDRVLNNRGGVSPRTAERIRLIADKLNYTPSITGRGLAVMKKDLKFGFVMTAQLWDNSSVSRALERKSAEFAEYCITVISKHYSEGNPTELLRVLEELQEEGVSGIALTPMDDPKVEEKINALTQEGIAVVTYEHDLPNTQRLAYVGCDYYCNGQTIAGTIRMVLGGRGKVGILSGTLSAQAHGQRIAGIEDRLAETSPEIQVVVRMVCEEDDVSTYSAVKKMLEQHPDLDLLVLNVVSTFGSMRAVKEWGEPLHVVSTNRVTEMENYLLDGSVDAVVTHQPWVQTDMSLDVLFQYLVWGKKPHFTTFFSNDEIVIAENIRSKRQML